MNAQYGPHSAVSLEGIRLATPVKVTDRFGNKHEGLWGGVNVMYGGENIRVHCNGTQIVMIHNIRSIEFV